MYENILLLRETIEMLENENMLGVLFLQTLKKHLTVLAANILLVLRAI